MSNPIKINNYQNAQNQDIRKSENPGSEYTGPGFSEVLKDSAEKIKFSNHAQKRIQTRNINLTEDGLSRLSNAIDSADKHGGKESLVLVDDLAFIINVKDRLVVTAIDNNKIGDGVFTKIDSVVIANKVNEYKTENI